MWRPFDGFFRDTFVAGLLLLVPITVLLLLVGRVIGWLAPVAEEVADILGERRFGPFVLAAITLASLVVAAFLLGLAASTLLGHRLVDVLERGLLNRLPGYSIIKAAAADAARHIGRIEAPGGSKPVFVRVGDGWQLGFLMEQLGEDLFAVFTPDAPTPAAGPLLLLPADQFVESGMTTAEAIDFLLRLGGGGLPKGMLPGRAGT
jgi:uncharacterized membrane protein